MRGGGERLYRAAQAIGPLAGALSRARMFSRIPLTPEGVPLQEAIAAIDALMEEGVRVLNFSFHSPTLEPGHTPYVRDEADLAVFYRWWGGVLAHLARRGVTAASIDQLIAAVPPRGQACKAA